jgi:hypothetical protein
MNSRTTNTSTMKTSLKSEGHEGYIRDSSVNEILVHLASIAPTVIVYRVLAKDRLSLINITLSEMARL